MGHTIIARLSLAALLSLLAITSHPSLRRNRNHTRSQSCRKGPSIMRKLYGSSVLLPNARSFISRNSYVYDTSEQSQTPWRASVVSSRGRVRSVHGRRKSTRRTGPAIFLILFWFRCHSICVCVFPTNLYTTIHVRCLLEDV